MSDKYHHSIRENRFSILPKISNRFYRANPKNFIFPYINWIGNEIPVENVSIFVPPRESGDKSPPLNTKRSVNRLTKEEGTTENIYENTHTVWISRIV